MKDVKVKSHLRNTIQVDNPLLSNLTYKRFRRGSGGYYVGPDGQMIGSGYSKEEAQQDTLEALEYYNKLVRVAALGLEGGWDIPRGQKPRPTESSVKVIFREGGNSKRNGREVAYFMSSQTYNSIPIGKRATPEDFARYGKIIEAKNTDIYDTEMED